MYSKYDYQKSLNYDTNENPFSRLLEQIKGPINYKQDLELKTEFKKELENGLSQGLTLRSPYEDKKLLTEVNEDIKNDKKEIKKEDDNFFKDILKAFSQPLFIGSGIGEDVVNLYDNYNNNDGKIVDYESNTFEYYKNGSKEIAHKVGINDLYEKYKENIYLYLLIGVFGIVVLKKI